MLSTKHGQKLFMQSNGTPMVFHLPPGQTKKKLAPLIKRYGGEITSRNLNNVIHLVDEKLWTSRLLSSSSDLHYWPTYIIDCVKQDSLLDLDLYKCSKGKHLMRKISLEEGEDGTDEYDFTFEDNAGRAVVANKKG
ncbi:telomeric repeat-binding factor 2-interacting protein 1-like [Babylonia areolata]|uniref:telomeric repeat-binding factor 2-interacting protein 1-like n=1 Tax=Babylonia areolata TaxID=304850 RepID=UPI003FCF53BE